MSYFRLKNGMQLYYEDVGTGEPVVFLHGWTSSHAIYDAPVQKLSGKARCITYDHRGHYGSKDANGEPVTMETLASDLKELIEGLGLDNLTLVGWSMGAGVVMTYIRDNGCDGLKQVVLCDMTPKQLNDDEWKLGLYQGNYTKEDMERDASRKFIKLYQAFAEGAVPKLKKLPGFMVRHLLRKGLKQCDEPVLRTLSKSMKQLDNRDVIGRITVPLTYVYAVPGSLFSPELAEWYRSHANVPFNAVPIANSAHMLVSEHPDEFAAAIEKLL